MGMGASLWGLGKPSGRLAAQQLETEPFLLWGAGFGTSALLEAAAAVQEHPPPGRRVSVQRSPASPSSRAVELHTALSRGTRREVPSPLLTLVASFTASKDPWVSSPSWCPALPGRLGPRAPTRGGRGGPARKPASPQLERQPPLGSETLGGGEGGGKGRAGDEGRGMEPRGGNK